MEGFPNKEKYFSRADMIKLIDDMDEQLVRIDKDFPCPRRQKTKMSEEIEEISEEHEVDASKLQVKAHVASGTFGLVFKGDYEGQDVAVKVLEWGDEKFNKEDEINITREAFREEVLISQTLDHHNIAKFIGAAIDLPIEIFQIERCQVDMPKSVACIISEYLHGGDLKSYLKSHKQRKLPFKTLIRLALDLAKGISYMHSKRIVHRDIKPENMLLHNDGTLKIIDFGFARIEDPSMKCRAGTKSYMAPEVLLSKPYNRKCDVYSFGICLWQMYHCDSPYRDIRESHFKFMKYVVKKNKRPQISNSCPRSLAKLMKRCWDKDPEKRPEMSEVESILESLDTSKCTDMKFHNRLFRCLSLCRGFMKM